MFYVLSRHVFLLPDVIVLVIVVVVARFRNVVQDPSVYVYFRLIAFEGISRQMANFMKQNTNTHSRGDVFQGLRAIHEPSIWPDIAKRPWVQGVCFVMLGVIVQLKLIKDRWERAFVSKIAD
jgi:hypothetical protein